VYSFGVTLWEILTRSRPFAGMAAFEIQMGWIMQPEEMRLPAVKVDPSLTGPARRVMEELSSLVEDCTAADPVKRPSAKEIVARIRKAGASDNNA
jgi:serine/threonine protein kinase